MRQSVRASLPMGFVAMAIGVPLAWFVNRDALGQGWEYLPVYAGVAGLVTGSCCWWLFVARKAQYTIARGTLAGALTGALAHYVLWYVGILGANVTYLVTGEALSSLGEPPIDPLRGLIGAAVLALWGLLFLGWVTVPMGALSGALVVNVQRRRHEARHEKAATRNADA